MKVSSPVPAPALAGYLERILVIEHSRVNKPFILPLFANGSPTLLFQTSNGDIDGEATHNLTLFGQTVFPRKLTIKSDFTLIAYFFQPAAIYSIFGIPAHQLTDSPLPLDLLLGKEAAELEQRLLEARSVAAMLRSLDEFTLYLIRRAGNFRPGVLARAKRAAHAAAGVASCSSFELLRTVQNELCMTERSFQRLFNDVIGLSPGMYRRVRQFDTAFQQLNKGQFTKLSDIAFRNDYSDQSHYIRAFREFTGITPKAYLNWSSAT